MLLRPLPLILAGLAVTAALRAVFAVHDVPPPAALVALLAGPAGAAGSAPQAEPEPAAAAPAVNCETPEEMLRAIQEERGALEGQKQDLARRASEIDLAGEKLGIEQQRLGELKSEVEALLARAEQAQTADVARLVGLYSNMKPKEAAAIMNDLDIEVTVMVIGTMAERDGAPILANLDPIRARAISRIILERSKLPGDQRLDDLKL